MRWPAAATQLRTTTVLTRDKVGKVLLLLILHVPVGRPLDGVGWDGMGWDGMGSHMGKSSSVVGPCVPGGVAESSFKLQATATDVASTRPN